MQPDLRQPLSITLGLRPGMRVSIQRAPPQFFQKLGALPEGCEVLDSCKTGFDVTVFFASTKAELLERLPKLIHSMAVTGKIWIAYPDGNPGAQAPNEAFTRAAGVEMGLADVGFAWVDVEWSALQFVTKHRVPRPEVPRVQI